MTAARNPFTDPARESQAMPDDVPGPADFKTASQSLLRIFFGAVDTAGGLLQRYLLLIVALALLGAGLAWVYRLVVAPRYEYSMLLQCNGASRTPYTQVFQQLNSAVKVQQGAQLAALTGMPAASAQKIIWIKTSFPDAVPNNADSTELSFHRMLVQLRTTEQPLDANVQTALLRTVNDATYLRTAKQIEVAAVQEELTFIEKQLQSLDSLHRSYTAALAKGAASATQKEGLDAASTYQHALELQKEKGRLQTWLVAQKEPAAVVVPFYLSKAPLRLLWWIVIGAVIGAGIGVSLALLQWLKHWSAHV